MVGALRLRAKRGELFPDLAGATHFPALPFDNPGKIEESRLAFVDAASLLLTNGDGFRKQVNKRLGFPAGRKDVKDRVLALIAKLSEVAGLEAALAEIRALPPACYTDEDWEIVRASFVHWFTRPPN